MADDDLYAQRKHRYSDAKRWPIDRVLVVVTMTISIIALIFSLGVNYQRLNAVADDVALHKRVADDTFVRRDVSAAQWESVNYQLQQLRMQVDELTAIVMEQQRRQTPRAQPTPRFR